MFNSDEFSPQWNELIGFCNLEMLSHADAFWIFSSVIDDIFTGFRNYPGLLLSKDSSFSLVTEKCSIF